MQGRRGERGRDLDAPSGVGHGRRGPFEDVDDVGGLFAAGPVRPAFGDGGRHLGDTTGPRGPAIAGADEWDRLVDPAVRPDLDTGVEVLEAAERQ